MPDFLLAKIFLHLATARVSIWLSSLCPPVGTCAVSDLDLGADEGIATRRSGWAARSRAVMAPDHVSDPDGRRTRYELADERLGQALDGLRSVVVAVETDRTCVDADEKGCC
ncbi:hypothetical protein [Streptomyces sp. SID12488]|uniref:hypothetical protein n=1 Tax=Streptomyces sp. SID12488 TaxID=2706040 RepID=UPI001EF1BACB|nr:hypothetical protein [Streptomyces sp. SID12488]